MPSNKKSDDTLWGRRNFLVTGTGILAGLAGGCAALDRRGYQSSLGELSGKFSARPLPHLGRENGAGIDETWIEKFIVELVNNDPGNSMEAKFPGEKIYQSSLVGFVSGADPIFDEYKKIIGPFHLTPAEVINMAAKEQEMKTPPTDQIGVVSFILPFSDPIVQTNAEENRWCSSRWGFWACTGPRSTCPSSTGRRWPPIRPPRAAPATRCSSGPPRWPAT